MEKFPKFIIEGENLIICKVTFHKEMVTDFTAVKGGGWFKFLPETNALVLYGDSFDFGKAKLEDIKKCVESGNVYSDIHLHRNITNKYRFGYDTGTEVIDLTPTTPPTLK